MNIPAGAYVFVADGRQLLLFENTGLAADPKLEVKAHRERASVATRDQGADRPGKTQARVGGARSAHEQTDFHRQDEDELAAEGADMLRRSVLAGEVKALIVVAAPRILGQLRKRYHGEVRSRIRAEIAKEVAGRPANEIATVVVNGRSCGRSAIFVGQGREISRRDVHRGPSLRSPRRAAVQVLGRVWRA